MKLIEPAQPTQPVQPIDPITRRHFLHLAALSTAGVLAGCAVNPVTGQSQLMMMSQNDEIQVDKNQSPFQFSADYGTVQDNALNAYIDRTGKTLAARSHRPNMPYNFRGVNAPYVNAYAFPGGSIAVSRGILVKMENEAELAALLGHELGHVNARHTAQQMTKGTLAQLLLQVGSIAAGTQGAAWGDLAANLGGLGATMFLASYSRDNEREADALGMQYAVQSGYSSEGMVGLMDILNNLNKGHSSSAAVLFSTHPMSSERYHTALSRARGQYGVARSLPLYRERYMDHTARVRALAPAIEAMQKGQEALAKKNLAAAETHFKQALAQAPDDYAANVMMAKCLIVQKRPGEAERYAEKAKQIYPAEAQGYHLSSLSKLYQRKYDRALADLNAYDRLLPGNPGVAFMKGRAYEGMGRRPQAAEQYRRYLSVTQQGDQAQYAYGQLKKWGYLR
ncbi:MAG: M48 family metalloprotease [Desulfobacterales bacterium]